MVSRFLRGIIGGYHSGRLVHTTGAGELNCYDPGIWFACCIESLKWLKW